MDSGNLTVEEANEIISKYMGLEYPAKSHAGYFRPNPNFCSLDALVPVWEKITNDTHPQGVIIESIISCDLDYSNFIVRSNWQGPKWQGEVAFESETGDGYSEKPKTIQEAACIATAKAIKELD